MKPTPINENALSQKGIQESVSFAISESGLPHLLDILRNSMYSDKVLAVQREYACNAVDAHVQTGQPERPIVIGLPTRLLPEFSVRDYGKGLTPDEVRTIYTQYGESTKRGTNDAIGMFGIGCKSAFAYSDSFMVKSYVDGKCYHYNAVIDPSKVGQCDLLGVSDTDEKNGIEVIIPVEPDDINVFEEKAQAFFRYFKVKPVMKGRTNFFEDQKDPILSGDGWEWNTSNAGNYSYDCSPVAIMGNVAYRIDKNNLKNIPDGLSNMFSECLHLEFEIGELSVAASREMLEYTDATIKKIVEKMLKIKEEIVGQIHEKFANEKSYWGAKLLYGELFDYGSGYYTLSRIVEKVDYKGEVIDSANISAWELRGSPSKIYHYEKSRNTQKWRRIESRNITVKPNTVVYHNDLPNSRGLYARCASESDAGNDVYLFNCPETHVNSDGKTINGMDEFLDVTKIDCEIKKLSEVALPEDFGKRTTSGTRSYTPANPKNNLKVFKFVSDGSAGDTGNDSDYWKPVDCDLNEQTDAVFVEIDRYKVEGTSPSQFFSKLRDMREVVEDIPSEDEIYAVKSAAVKKLGKGWTPLRDVTFQRVVKWAEETDAHENAIDWCNRDNIRTAGNFFFNDDDKINRLRGQLNDKNHLYLELVDAANTRADRSPFNNYRNLRFGLTNLGIAMEEIEKVMKPEEAMSEDDNPYMAQAKELLEEYPMLKFVKANDYYNGIDLEDVKYLSAYLNGK